MKPAFASMSEPLVISCETKQLKSAQIVISQLFFLPCFSSLRLDESCSKYRSQINRLEEELDQEKKRFNMLEIRLRNSERAHKDAETRNILLQQEMEEFFKTLGDLTTGAAQTN